MSAVIKNSVAIDQNWLQLNRNKKAKLTFIERFGAYTNENIGLFRCVQVLKRVIKIREEAGYAPTQVTQELDKAANGTMLIMSIGRLPSVTADAYRSVVNLTRENGVSLSRKVGNIFKNVGEGIYSWTSSVMFLTGNFSMREVARFSDLSSDIADLSLSAVDYQQASALEGAANGEAKKVFSHAKNYYWLRVAKATLSVALAVLSVVFIYAGVTLLSALALSSLALAGIFLSIRRDLFKYEGEYNVPNLDRPVELLV